MENCFKCIQCDTSTGVIDKYATPIHPLYWKRVTFSKCFEKWYICTHHVLKRWKINQFHKAMSHFTHVEHGNKLHIHTNAEHTQNNHNEYPHNDVITYSPNNTRTKEDIITLPHSQCTGTNRKAKSLLSISEFSHVRISKQSTQYFANEYHSDGLGLYNIIACAFANSPACSESSNKEEAHFHLLLLSLLHDLTGPQRERLVSLLEFLQNNPSPFQHSRLPTTMSDINKIYITGVNSITSNTPHPLLSNYLSLHSTLSMIHLEMKLVI